MAPESQGERSIKPQTTRTVVPAQPSPHDGRGLRKLRGVARSIVSVPRNPRNTGHLWVPGAQSRSIIGMILACAEALRPSTPPASCPSCCPHKTPIRRPMGPAGHAERRSTAAWGSDKPRPSWPATGQGPSPQTRRARLGALGDGAVITGSRCSGRARGKGQRRAQAVDPDDCCGYRLRLRPYLRNRARARDGANSHETPHASGHDNSSARFAVRRRNQ